MDERIDDPGSPCGARDQRRQARPADHDRLDEGVRRHRGGRLPLRADGRERRRPGRAEPVADEHPAQDRLGLHLRREDQHHAVRLRERGRRLHQVGPHQGLLVRHGTVAAARVLQHALHLLDERPCRARGQRRLRPEADRDDLRRPPRLARGDLRRASPGPHAQVRDPRRRGVGLPDELVAHGGRPEPDDDARRATSPRSR